MCWSANVGAGGWGGHSMYKYDTVIYIGRVFWYVCMRNGDKLLLNKGVERYGWVCLPLPYCVGELTALLFFFFLVFLCFLALG